MGAVGTHTLIQKITVGSAGTASITFSSIPATYTDLYLKLSLRSGRSAYRSAGAIQFNADTGVTRYSYRRLYSSGTTPGSDSSSSMGFILIGEIVAASSTASTFTNTEVYIPQYTSSNAKSVSIDAAVEQNDATNNRVSLTANLYNAATNAAITSIKIFDGDDPASLLQQYSSVSLYGVTTSSVPASPTPQAQGGDIIVNDGTYWYHAFISTGAFVPKRTLTADVLVIAGGGGGAAYYGGGGGAGGVCYQTNRSLAYGSHTVTIGAGGAGSNPGQATNGVNSLFGDTSIITADGGGGGGFFNAGTGSNGSSGGSGGGGSMGNTANTATTGGSATQGSSGGATGYGNAGGGGWRGSVPAYKGGGGGGSGGTGNTANQDNNLNGSTGGAGLNTWSTWASTTGTGVSGYYAGGGGGSTEGTTALKGLGGSGGGGNGAAPNYSLLATAGTANTGSGGGSDGASGSPGGAGGSGIVIIRYKL